MAVLYLACIYDTNVTSLIQLKMEKQISHCFPPKNNNCMLGLSFLTVPTNVIILVKRKYISSQTLKQLSMATPCLVPYMQQNLCLITHMPCLFCLTPSVFPAYTVLACSSDQHVTVKMSSLCNRLCCRVTTDLAILYAG